MQWELSIISPSYSFRFPQHIFEMVTEYVYLFSGRSYFRVFLQLDENALRQYESPSIGTN
jgi:hypothetical protein